MPVLQPKNDFLKDLTAIHWKWWWRKTIPLSLSFCREVGPWLWQARWSCCKINPCGRDATGYCSFRWRQLAHRWPVITHPSQSQVLNTLQLFILAEFNSEPVLTSLPCYNSLEQSLPCLLNFVQCNFGFNTIKVLKGIPSYCVGERNMIEEEVTKPGIQWTPSGGVVKLSESPLHSYFVALKKNHN